MTSLSHLRTVSPLFISFEGGDGVGKTTQIDLLEKAFQDANIPYIRTKEPGGCPQAMELRKLLLEGDDNKWDGVSELLLMSAARREHLRCTVRPALDAGKWVLCDRFADCTTAYQGYGRGLDLAEIQRTHNLVVEDMWPQLTFILSGDVEEGLARPKDREDAKNETRFESVGIDFHMRVKQGYLTIAKDNPQRCRVINAKGTIDEVHADICQTLTTFLAQRASA